MGAEESEDVLSWTSARGEPFQIRWRTQARENIHGRTGEVVYSIGDKHTSRLVLYGRRIIPHVHSAHLPPPFDNTPAAIRAPSRQISRSKVVMLPSRAPSVRLSRALSWFDFVNKHDGLSISSFRQLTSDRLDVFRMHRCLRVVGWPP